MTEARENKILYEGVADEPHHALIGYIGSELANIVWYLKASDQWKSFRTVGKCGAAGTVSFEQQDVILRSSGVDVLDMHKTEVLAGASPMVGSRV